MKNFIKPGLTFPIIGLLLVFSSAAYSQEQEKKPESGYVFTVLKQLPATSIKNQYQSSTCWSYSTISFLESELLRIKKDTFNLSEMYCVRKCYADKADLYVRYHGKHNFGSGGESHDVTYVLKNYGLVPNEVYPGTLPGEDKPVHGEMDAVLNADVDALIKNPNSKLTTVWQQGFNGLLDAYLGKVPDNFTYKGKQYSPKSFSDMLGLNPDDYIEFTSYIHHPFYSKFILEIEDNWLMDEDYNVPIEDLVRIIDNSIDKGYTVVWGADVSEKGFSWRNGVAVVPDKNATEATGLDKEKWEKMSGAEREKVLFKFEKPMPEKKITQEMRQKEFDNYQTTDDHGMHITGVATDQNGVKYYLVKNSWGTEGSPYKGYFYASESYVKLKTMDIMVNKEAVPKDIRKRLGF